MERHTLHSNLRMILTNKDISIRQLSKEAELPFESCRKLYHNEATSLSRDIIGQICAYLNITPNDLFTVVKKPEQS